MSPSEQSGLAQGQHTACATAQQAAAVGGEGTGQRDAAQPPGVVVQFQHEVVAVGRIGQGSVVGPVRFGVSEQHPVAQFVQRATADAEVMGRNAVVHEIDASVGVVDG